MRFLPNMTQLFLVCDGFEKGIRGTGLLLTTGYIYMSRERVEQWRPENLQLRCRAVRMNLIGRRSPLLCNPVYPGISGKRSFGSFMYEKIPANVINKVRI